jgi:hypothetical protein
MKPIEVQSEHIEAGATPMSTHLPVLSLRWQT